MVMVRIVHCVMILYSMLYACVLYLVYCGDALVCVYEYYGSTSDVCVNMFVIMFTVCMR